VKEDSIQMTDDLLVKCMLGEASEKELTLLNRWVFSSKDNARYYDDFRLIWERSKELANQSTVDEHEAWERFRARVDDSTPVVALPANQWRSWVRMAASFFIFAGVGWAIYFVTKNSGSSELKTVSAGAVPLTDTLPDGSQVTLNKRSSISYATSFDDADSRRITLTGEAFFNVVPNKKKPFVVTVNNVTVTVLGTSFNVKSHANRTEVIVETGVVKVARKEKTVRLTRHEKVVVLQGQNDFVRQSSTDEFYKYYRTGNFVCRDMPLSELVGKLNEIYDANIVIENDRIKNLKINTTFEQKSLSKDLHVIGTTFDIGIERHGDSIVLK
jgi:transmembrane sensor